MGLVVGYPKYEPYTYLLSKIYANHLVFPNGPFPQFNIEIGKSTSKHVLIDYLSRLHVSSTG